MAPIALSGASWEATRGWFGKWASFVLALIVSKLVIVVVFLVATAQVSAPIDFDLVSISQPISGIVLMFVAAFAPYMVYKFISFMGFDIYHSMSAEQEAKNALNRPLPMSNKPPGGEPKKILDGGGTPTSSGGGPPTLGGRCRPALVAQTADRQGPRERPGWGARAPPRALGASGPVLRLVGSRSPRERKPSALPRPRVPSSVPRWVVLPISMPVTPRVQPWGRRPHLAKGLRPRHRCRGRRHRGQRPLRRSPPIRRLKNPGSEKDEHPCLILMLRGPSRCRRSSSPG